MAEELLGECAVIAEDMAQGVVVAEVAVGVQVAVGRVHHMADREPEGRREQKHQVLPDHRERSVEVVPVRRQQGLSLPKHGR